MFCFNKQFIFNSKSYFACYLFYPLLDVIPPSLMQNVLQPSQSDRVFISLVPVSSWDSRSIAAYPGGIHAIVWATLETRISLCCLHNFHAGITKGHLFGPLVSQSFPCWGVKGRSGPVDCGGWQSHIVWTSAASQRGHCGEWWPRERGLGLGWVTEGLGTGVAAARPKAGLRVGVWAHMGAVTVGNHVWMKSSCAKASLSVGHHA